MFNARWLLDSDHVRRDFDTDNIFLVEDNDDALTLRRQKRHTTHKATSGAGGSRNSRCSFFAAFLSPLGRAPIVRFPLGDGTLSVRTPRGDTWHIPVQHGDTIGHIKMKIECAHGVDRARQRLFLGKDVLGDAGIAWPAVTLELVWSMRCSLSCTDRTPTIHSRFYFEVDGLRPEQTFDVTALLQVTGRDAACPEGRLIPGYTSDSTSPAQRAAGKRRIQWRNDSTFTLGMDVRVDVDRAWLDQLIDETVDRDGYAAIDYWPTTYFHIPGSSPVTIQLEVDGRQPIRIILQRNSLDMMREVRHMIAASCDVLLGSIHSILLQKACSRPLWASDIVFLNTDDTLLITLKSTTKKSSGDQALATTPTSPPGESIYERPPPHRLTPPRKRRIGQRVIDFGPASKRTNLHTETTPATPTHEAIKLTSQTVIDSPPKRVKQEAPDSQDDARADRCLHLSTPPAHGRLVHT